MGFFTATESAVVGVILVLGFYFFRGQLTLYLLKDAVWTSIKTVGSLYLIVIGASIFNYLITVTQLPFAVVDFINHLTTNSFGSYIGNLCNIYSIGNRYGFISNVIFNNSSFLSSNS